jgi:hypothetical protein
LEEPGAAPAGAVEVLRVDARPPHKYSVVSTAWGRARRVQPPETWPWSPGLGAVRLPVVI